MVKRVLLAVDDSAASLAAATLAIDIASITGSALRIVHVVADGAVTTLLSSSGVGDVADWQRRTGGGLLDHLAARAERAGVHPEKVQMLGEPAERVLADARSWRADLIVIGRSSMRGAGQPYIGQSAQRVLEFAEQPVLVVPPPMSSE
ncbi:MAG: universal stress protein [Nocardioidaceae bacterium]